MKRLLIPALALTLSACKIDEYVPPPTEDARETLARLAATATDTTYQFRSRTTSEHFDTRYINAQVDSSREAVRCVYDERTGDLSRLEREVRDPVGNTHLTTMLPKQIPTPGLPLDYIAATCADIRKNASK